MKAVSKSSKKRPCRKSRGRFAWAPRPALFRRRLIMTENFRMRAEVVFNVEYYCRNVLPHR